MRAVVVIPHRDTFQSYFVAVERDDVSGGIRHDMQVLRGMVSNAMQACIEDLPRMPPRGE